MEPILKTELWYHSTIQISGANSRAHKMMLSVYIIFLYNLATSVYIMRLVDKNKIEEAVTFNSSAAKVLAALVIIALIQFFF